MFHRAVVVGLDIAQPVDGGAQGVHHPAQHGIAHGDVGVLPVRTTRLPSLDLHIVAEEDDADAVPAHVLHHALQSAVEDDDLAIGGVVDAVDDGDAVAHGLDGADLLGQGGQIEQLHLRAEDGDDALGAGGLQPHQLFAPAGPDGPWRSSHTPSLPAVSLKPLTREASSTISKTMSSSSP